jgi:putative mRNA 3-end processing factor
MAPLVELNGSGLYCPAAGTHIDPWKPARRAVITHAHADRVCPGSDAYLTLRSGEALLRSRLGPEARIETLPAGESLPIDGVKVSLHPAGHILGSAQVRLERGGEVWVVTGDVNPVPSPCCEAFEPLRCQTLVTEATFALPIFRWHEERGVVREIEAWWRSNQEAGKASLLYAQPLGNAQRVLSGIDSSIGPIHAHEAVEAVSRFYRASGVPLPETVDRADWKRALIVAPRDPGAASYGRSFGPVSTAMASGWMRIRGTRRRRSLDRGFILSGHADWPGLLKLIDESGAERVWVTHGHRAVLVRWLEEHGREALAIETPFAEDES